MRFFLCALYLCSTLVLSAQHFGAFPPSVRWKEIDSDTSRIIFQQPVKKQADRIASIINRMARENPNPLGNTVRKVNTVLHSNTTLANGFVALAPFRSEYYLIPHTDIFSMGANPWQEELAVHEYRHVQQYANFNKGISRVATFILGEEGQALLNSAAVPDWFFEGDAVHAESALTPQGRGRIPHFFNGYNALFRERKNYSWMKLRNGSMKDYVPNHYQLGYLLVNYGYMRYGSAFWGKVTSDAAAFKSVVYPFQAAVKRHTGMSFTQFRSEAINYYKSQVSQKRTDTIRNSVTYYHFPQYISSDTLIYLKSSYSEIPAFYLRSNGEHRITQRNISTEEWFSYRNGKIIYTGYDVSSRWNLRDYSNIIVFDIRTGEERTLTTKSRYFNPDLSPAGNHLIAAFVNDSAGSELHLLHADGTLAKKWDAADDAYFLHTRFADDEHVVYAARHSNSMMSLNLLNTTTGKVDTLVKATYALLGYPQVDGDHIYFVSSLAGNDDLYMVSRKTKMVNQLLVGAGGNYFPQVRSGNMVWSKFSSNGLHLQTAVVDDLPRRSLSQQDWSSVTLPFQVAGDDTLPNILNTPLQTFPSGDYKAGKHLFNFHSWRPYFSDPEFTFSVYSDNVLSNFRNELFYRYNRSETSHAAGFTSYYAGFFPVLNAGATYTFDRTVALARNTLHFNQAEWQTGYHIPLNFTEGNMYRFLTFGTNVVHNRLVPTGLYRDSFKSVTNNYLHHFVNWSQQLPRALQQIFPKFGVTATAAHRHLIGNSGYQFIGGVRMFLPSIKNHSIVVAASIQQSDTGNVVFSNRFATSRGYSDRYTANENRRWRISGNYHFPLFYPDWGFANLVYFLRLRSNIFYDYTKVLTKAEAPSRELRSVGAEWYFDSKLWNQLPVTFGFRISHLLNRDFTRPAGSNVFEVIVPIDLIPR